MYPQKTILSFVMIFAVVFTQAAFAQEDVSTGNIHVFLGGKGLDKDDWGPAEEQGEFGIEVDFRGQHWPVSVAIDLMGARGEKNNIESRTSELNIGIRKIGDRFPIFRPFIGGGFSFARGEIENTVSGVSEEGSGVGLWLAGGIYWALGPHFNLGLEIKASSTEIQFSTADVNAGGGHFGLLAGYHW